MLPRPPPGRPSDGTGRRLLERRPPRPSRPSAAPPTSGAAASARRSPPRQGRGRPSADADIGTPPSVATPPPSSPPSPRGVRDGGGPRGDGLPPRSLGLGRGQRTSRRCGGSGAWRPARESRWVVGRGARRRQRTLARLAARASLSLLAETGARLTGLGDHRSRDRCHRSRDR